MAAPCLGQRRDVLLQDLAILLVLYRGQLCDRLRLPLVAGGRVAGDGVGSGHRLVCRAEVPVLPAVLVRLCDLDAASGVVEGRLAAAEDRVDPRNLPLAAAEIHLLADLAP